MRLTISAVISACGLMIISVAAPGKEGFSAGTGESRATVRAINGNPLQVNVGSDHSFQVFNTTVPGGGQIYPNSSELADFGWMLRVGNALYAPQFGSRPTATGALGATINYTQPGVSSVTGNGSAAAPFSVTVTANAGSGLNLTQVVSYVNGESFFRKQLTIDNTSATSSSVRVFLGADIFLASSDVGRSQYLSASGSVGGLTCEGVSPTYNILLIPQSNPTPTAYTADTFNAVWAQIASGDLSGTTNAASCFDNGAALQWNLDIPAGGSAVIRAATSFGAIPTIVQPPAASTTPIPTLNALGAAVLIGFAVLGGLVVLRREG
ncbi:MAG: hypothetical protein MUE46_20830 [Xanthomonadales bacterium]|jgi:hypothetical protein|nr:hypothetical protein [Xanthomonadales bacterium]